MRIVSLAAILFLIAAAIHPVQAQDAGGKARLYGTVTDKSTGEPVAGANVVLVGTRFGAATDLEGEYEIVNVPPGPYAVIATFVGYREEARTSVSLTPARPVRLNFQLEQTDIRLEDVVVRAPLFQKDADEKISSVTVSNEEIRRLPGGFEDVLRAVSILPGVAQPMAGRNDLIVRGGAPSENLYLLDNIEIPNINHFGTQGSSGGPQSFVNLDFVDRTQFNAGGFGARYGDRLSSVLRIDLREGRDDHLGGKATISASQFGLNLEGPLPGQNERGSFLFSARRSYLDFLFKALGVSFIPQYWDFLGKASHSLGPRDYLSFTGIGAIDFVTLANSSADQRYDNSSVLAPKQNTAVGGLTWKHLYGKGFSTVTLSQTYQDFDAVQRDSLLNEIFRNTSIEREWGLRGDLVWKLFDHTELAVGVQQKVGFYDAQQFARFESSFGDSLTLDQRYSEQSQKSAVYLEATQSIGRLRFTLGGRLDRFDAINNGSAFSPRGSATYALTPVTNLNASVGRYYQSPSMIWLLSNPANRDLKLIGVNQAVVGIDHLLRYDVRIGIEAYAKSYFDYPASVDRPWLVMANTGAGFGGSQDNFSAYGYDHLVAKGTGRAQGFEIFGQKKASDNPHYALVSLSYNETFFTGLDGIERPGSFDQRWIFNLGGGFIFNRNLQTSVRFRLATGMPYTPYESDGSQDPAKFNSKRTPVNHSLDLRIDRHWYLSSWTLITYLDVQNVYNRAFEGAPRWDPRSKSTVVDESIGILPSIGISVEF